MAVNLSYFPYVTLIGDTTAGCITETISLRLSSLWFVKIGTGTVLAQDFQWIEGAGIAPDYNVEVSEADFEAGIDPVLEFAIELLEQ
jgi:C-terminal processing protease CtpA/Prc